MSDRLKSLPPTAQHLAFRKALEAAIAQHGRELQAFELLAITSNLVGQLVALQDQRVMTPAMAMDLVAKNIASGNSQVMNSLLIDGGGHA